jgi:hypothetical protein
VRFSAGPTAVRKIIGGLLIGLILLAVFYAMSEVASASDGHSGWVRCRGRIRNRNVKRLPIQTVALFTVFEATPKYRILWSEVRTLTVDEQGDFDVILGTASSDDEPAKYFNVAGDSHITVEVEIGDSAHSRVAEVSNVLVEPASVRRER